MSTVCRHCHRCRINRPRGLCWGCYYTPGVRERYPSTSKFAYRGVGNNTGVAPLPRCATVCLPGSAAKIEVLAERARREESLFHPADARGLPADAVRKVG
ncbi:MAG: hypothetical protein K1X57_21170 [Gemmataceae bacterium]|nr:hypothetical protein [Gemmataceae bacterium]